MSSYGEKVMEFCNFVCNDTEEKPQPVGNPLLEDLRSMAEKLNNALKSTSEICQDLDRFSSNELPSRLSNPTLPVGQTNAPLLVSLKQLGDSVFSSTKEGSFDFNQDDVESIFAAADANLSKATDYVHSLKRTNYQLERLYRSVQRGVAQSEVTLHVTMISV
uniref:Vinculin n=1 Tax=Dendroctonus ponderosae TaxID=77166 RepID=A0AAR5PKE9_DENPD